MFTFLRAHFVRVTLSLLIVLLFLLNSTRIMPIDIIDKFERIAYDFRLNITLPNKVDKRIVIVDVDELSLQEQGRWPWSREKVAKLVNVLFDQYQIKTLGFDLIFAEKDTSSGIESLEALLSGPMKDNTELRKAVDYLRPSLDYDQALADSFKGRPIVLGYYFSHFKPAAKESGILPPHAILDDSINKSGARIIKATSFGANLPLLQRNALSGGHLNPEPDEDGIFRRVSMLEEYEGKQYASLSLAVAQVALGGPVIKPGFAEGSSHEYPGLEWLQLGDKHIPINEKLTALVPYLGKQGSFHYVSATDVINGRAPADVLKGAIILVGTSAPGLMDLRATPVQNVYPGVEVHANMVAGILDQSFKQQPAYTAGVEILTILLVGVLMAFVLPKASPLGATAVFFGIMSALVGFNILAWQSGLVLPIASELIMVVIIFMVNMSYGFFVESNNKQHLAGLFGQYVPQELVDEMASAPKDFTLEGESREMTVMFSDIRNFTNISEGLDPKELTHMMNEYLTPMTSCIHKTRGTIDKYIGDAIMAFWGAPIRDVDHAKHAVEAALDMVDGLIKLEQEFVKRGWPAIDIGVGLNSGQMVVGNMGSRFRTAYTVMGDSVNLASRLEGLTKEYGVKVVVSENTKKLLPDMRFRELDRVRVKGREQPVSLYEPIRYLNAEQAQELDDYHEALAAYRNQDIINAEVIFMQLHNDYPQVKLYAIYLSRIEKLKLSRLDNDWDGVHNFKEK